ncbi:hypothetical protein MRBLMI12_000418 [Microbacterium sp. LMI12-1-1.1]|uniref:hypothetical protein n=1 Tax=Microbacterium sp. LMI12-1-1.1 TaxID=3135225 RepID=UPI00342B4C4E
MTVALADVRSLVRDDGSVVFTDAQLTAAINATGNTSALRAAGNAFQSLAAEYAIKGRSVKTDDLAIDTRNRGKDLLEVANSFFAEAEAADKRAAGSFVAIVPVRGSKPRVTRIEATPAPVIEPEPEEFPIYFIGGQDG